MKIHFVTSNQRKIMDARAACSLFDIEVEPLEFPIDEIQHHDPLQISRHKAQQAYQLAKQPIVINDASWSIPALNGFPGGYMKEVAAWFSPDDFIRLVQGKDNRICCIETVIYIDGDHQEVFQGEYWATVSPKPRGVGNSIEQVAVFGGKTIGEYRAAGKLAIDPKDYIWHDFAKWYVDWAKKPTPKKGSRPA